MFLHSFKVDVSDAQQVENNHQLFGISDKFHSKALLLFANDRTFHVDKDFNHSLYIIATRPYMQRFVFENLTFNFEVIKYA